MRDWTRFWIGGLAAAAGLFGAFGVALAAAGAHVTGGGSVTTAAQFLLFHAAALVALAACAAVSARPRVLCVAASLIAAGTVLFSGDLALRGLAGIAPLRLAAPTGGVVLILGWLVGAVGAPRALHATMRR